MKGIISLFVLAVFVTACTATKALGPSQADVDRMQSKFNGYTLADLTQGKALYEGNCGTCHALFDPNSRGEEQWKGVVPPMVQKVNKKQKALDASQEELILKYLITMSTVK